MTSSQEDPTGVFSVFKQDNNRSTPFYCRWTTEEDKLLMEAVKEHGPHKWSLIAQHIPDRTPVQCSTRWLGALNPNVHKGKWAPDEDEALTQAVQKYSNKNVLPWNRIAQHIPNRTGIQCQARWTEALDPTVRKGRWKKEEDDMLREGVTRFGCCWIRVSGMIHGRTQRQCRTRWNQIKSRKEKAIIINKKNKATTTTTTTTTQDATLIDDIQERNSLSLSPTLSLEENLLSTPPISPLEHYHLQLQLQQQEEPLQWMNLPQSINVAVDPCETDYFCLSPPSPSSSLNDMLTLPDDDDTIKLDQLATRTPCEFFHFNPELPTSSLMLPDSDFMLNQILSPSSIL
ncbi:Homeodomain-like protein [Chlamydoabsidia padenii]|nr:Homeodomain-like protein [Chlamydoabsidia padenii]